MMKENFEVQHENEKENKMIKLFLMLIALILVNGLSTDIVDAADLDYENQDQLIESSYVNVKAIKMAEGIDYRDNQILQMDEVITDVKLLGPHQVGFTVENIVSNRKNYSELLTNQYDLINVSKAVFICQFDFG